MSKIISLTPEMIEVMTAEFSEQLSKKRFTASEFKYTRTFPEDKDDKAVLRFTMEAWNKMVAILRDFQKEVAWHGVANRVDGEDNTYVISDIMVYPQTVGSATVDMDEVAYSKWIVDHDGDERFDHIRFQGHSHVNMGTTPSGTDMQHQEEIVSQLDPDDFYIFAIYNKSMSRDIRIYDMRKNRVYDTADITVKIDYGFDMAAFLEECRSMVKEKAVGYSGSYTGYSGGHSDYSGYTGVFTNYSSQRKASSGTDEKSSPKPVSRPGDSGWNITNLFGGDESPFTSQK